MKVTIFTNGRSIYRAFQRQCIDHFCKPSEVKEVVFTDGGKFRMMPEYIAANGPGMYIHADMFPMFTLDEQLLSIMSIDYSELRSPGGSRQFTYVTGKSSADPREMREMPCPTLPCKMQYYNPGFIHADNYSTDSPDECREKLDRIKAIIRVPDSCNFSR